MKLHNSVVTELEEALRYSLIQMADSYSDTLVSTIEDNARTIVRYASNVSHLLLFVMSRNAVAVTECVRSVDSIMFLVYLMVIIFTSATNANTNSCRIDLPIPYRDVVTHKITGNYDCTFIYESLSSLLAIVQLEFIL